MRVRQYLPRSSVRWMTNNCSCTFVAKSHTGFDGSGTRMMSRIKVSYNIGFVPWRVLDRCSRILLTVWFFLRNSWFCHKSNIGLWRKELNVLIHIYAGKKRGKSIKRGLSFFRVRKMIPDKQCSRDIAVSLLVFCSFSLVRDIIHEIVYSRWR